jgi:hypothetical protein
VIAPGQGTVTTTSLAGGTVTTTADASINGLTVGKGGSAVATNTVVGASALQANTTGAQNIAIGFQAAYSNTTGELAALGSQALYSNTTGLNNAAFGRYRPLYSNTTGADNSAFGDRPLYSNTTGSYNTALGSNALYSNTTASYNTAVGYQAGYNSTGAYNLFMGYITGLSNTTGTQNTFVGGYGAGNAVTTGGKNTIVGNYSGNNGGLDIRTASNRVVLSDGDGNPRLYADNNGGWQSTSAVGNNTLYPAQFCRAWVWFNGADASIFGSANVSSVTRLANGSYTVNFTVAFPDNLYTGVTGFSRIDASAQFVNLGFSRTSSTDRVETFVGGGNAALSTIQIAYFR